MWLMHLVTHCRCTCTKLAVENSCMAIGEKVRCLDRAKQLRGSARVAGGQDLGATSGWISLDQHCAYLWRERNGICLPNPWCSCRRHAAWPARLARRAVVGIWRCCADSCGEPARLLPRTRKRSTAARASRESALKQHDCHRAMFARAIAQQWSGALRRRDDSAPRQFASPNSARTQVLQRATLPNIICKCLGPQTCASASAGTPACGPALRNPQATHSSLS